MKSKILIRFDDICPTMNWEQWHKAMDVIIKYGAKPLLGVVPDCQDPILKIDSPKGDFWEYIKNLQQQGWAIAMHGYQHKYDKVSKGLLTRCGNSEFAGHTYKVQYNKIKKGKELLEKHGVFTDIFFAPSHSYDKNTLRALAANGFRYISDGKTNKAIKRCGIICLPCISFGVPKIKRGYYTAIFHAHEWTKADKAQGFNKLQNLCATHTKELVDFETYKKQPLGNVFFQQIIEKIRLLWKHIIKPPLSKLKKMIFSE